MSGPHPRGHIAACDALARERPVLPQSGRLQGRRRRAPYWYDNGDVPDFEAGDTMSKNSAPPIAIVAAAAPVRRKPSHHPEPFFSRMNNRQKRTRETSSASKIRREPDAPLPGGECPATSPQHHDRFIYVLEAADRLPKSKRESSLPACARDSRRGVSPTSWSITLTRTSFTWRSGTAPRETKGHTRWMTAKLYLGPDGKWTFMHKDGRPY